MSAPSVASCAASATSSVSQTDHARGPCAVATLMRFTSRGAACAISGSAVFRKMSQCATRGVMCLDATSQCREFHQEADFQNHEECEILLPWPIYHCCSTPQPAVTASSSNLEHSHNLACPCVSVHIQTISLNLHFFPYSEIAMPQIGARYGWNCCQDITSPRLHASELNAPHCQGSASDILSEFNKSILSDILSEFNKSILHICTYLPFHVINPSFMTDR